MLKGTTNIVSTWHCLHVGIEVSKLSCKISAQMHAERFSSNNHVIG
jgi:hypothetical protein